MLITNEFGLLINSLIVRQNQGLCL